MGKKSSKRRTRWKALPLGGEDGASGSEDELSTTSSGRSPGLVLRMRDHSNRHTRRLCDRDRSREPLVKLESKTFDEEEYTKITTPRQDVLFKKGYFGRRKLESSIDEGVHITQGEVSEGEEEAPMEQMIITNGFVDERGHYLVNGTSYEIYDPYTNTVTVVVGPPPYTNGVTPPVLAAVSCQPVPLQPVDWYPSGPGQSDWPPGPAWAPAYPKVPENAEAGSPGATPAPGPEEPPVFQPPFLFQSLMFPVPFGLNGVGETPIGPGEEQGSSEKSCTPSEANTEQYAGEGMEPPPSTPLKPPAEEFRPRSVLKPPKAEFIPNSVLKPPMMEFVPQALQSNDTPSTQPNAVTHLKPNSAVFIPRQAPPPTPTATQSQPQESTISEQNADFLSQEDAVASVPKEVTSHHLPERYSQQEQTPKSKSPIPQEKEQTEVNVGVSQPSERTQSKASEKVAEADVEETEPPVSNTAKQPEEQSSTRTSHGTQTPPELDEPQLPALPYVPATSQRRVPPPSPRKSYAKTVSTGLEQRNEPISNGKPVTNAREINSISKDNNESDRKRIQNGTIFTNGHDSHEMITTAKETVKNSRNIRDNKKPLTNGTEKEANGFIDANEQGKSNWHNEINSHPSAKERLFNGKENVVRKEGRDMPSSKKDRDVNGHDVTNNRGNGLVKLVNGKDRTTQRTKPEKRLTPIKIISDGLENQSMTSADDSDSNLDQFRPVENRRNRAQYNGFSKNKNYPTRTKLELNEKEASDNLKIKEATSPACSTTLSRRESITKQSESEKSSSISELSSPTDLSSGQTTPPDNALITQNEELHANELNKSVEKLWEGMDERKPRKTTKKGRKSGARRVEPKEEKEEPVFEEPPPLPEFLQIPKDELMDLGNVLDQAILHSLRQKEPAISKVNLFATRAPSFPCDLYTKTNLSHMRATRPEEFFASIVENPTTPGELCRPNERPRRAEKPVKTSVDVRPVMRKNISTVYKPSRKPLKEEEEPEPQKEEKQEPRLGIVDAVKTWLETHEDALTPEETTIPEPKNGVSNPLRALSAERDDGGCGRVADGSLDLAALTDARTSVDKYYSLSVRRVSKTSETSDVSEQEAVDALEYAFPRPPALTTHTIDFPTKELACKLQ